MENTLPATNQNIFSVHSDVYRQSRRLAVIDMGSNSFRLIVIEYVPQLSFKMIDEVREAVRLSEGIGKDDRIQPAAMQRAIRAAQVYAAFCRASGISEILVAGTSAIRRAHNQHEFLAQVAATSGLQVRVLTDEEEAYYGYLAAVNSTTLRDGFVLDLGGGSLEVTRVEDRRMTATASLPLGAVVVTEEFLPYDPPTFRELERLHEHLRRQYAKLEWFNGSANMTLIGEGGTLRLIGRLAQKMSNYPLETLHGYTLSLQQIEAVYDQLASMDIASRKRLPGMKADRADISLAGALVILQAMKHSGFDSLTISSQGMREGLFYERFLPQVEGLPVLADVRQASVLNLAHLYHFQEQHARHVAQLTLSMFDQMRAQMPERVALWGTAERELLWAASMLHDIGVSVDYHDHHLHGAYLIINAGLPGYTHRETAIIALLTRYHRKGKVTVDEFAPLLEKGDHKRVQQLSALLRLAEQLDRPRDGSVRDVRIRAHNRRATIQLVVGGDARVAVWAVDNHRDVFEQAFGIKLDIVQPGDDQ